MVLHTGDNFRMGRLDEQRPDATQEGGDISDAFPTHRTRTAKALVSGKPGGVPKRNIAHEQNNPATESVMRSLALFNTLPWHATGIHGHKHPVLADPA